MGFTQLLQIGGLDPVDAVIDVNASHRRRMPDTVCFPSGRVHVRDPSPLGRSRREPGPGSRSSAAIIVDSPRLADQQASGQSREFTGAVVISDAALAEAVGVRLRLVAEPRRTVRREWFDTFDWRLHRAGLTLERATGTPGDAARLLLRGSAGNLLQVATLPDGEVIGSDTHEGFALDTVVPSGPLRRRLAPVVQMRALLTLARLTSKVRTFRAADGRAKTVARITVEESAGQATKSPPLMCRLSVVPVRGYVDQTDQLVRRLTAQPGLRPSSGGPLVQALAVAGRCPGDYTGQLDLTLESAMPAQAAIQAILSRLLDIAESNTPGVIADLDSEFLHDLRVSVRRARTALKLLGDALPAGEGDCLMAELKWIGDLTTPTRDLDCQLLALTSEGARGPKADDLLPFKVYLLAHRQRTQKALVRGLRSERWSLACQRWRALATAHIDGAGELETEIGARPIGQVAGPRIARAYRRARRLGDSIPEGSPGTDLHLLRKCCKELRYLLEFFAAILSDRPSRSVLTQLRALQDCLGDVQDTEVLHAAIVALADGTSTEAGLSAATLIAVGRFDDRLELRQRQARAQFSERFDRFAARRTRTHVADLTTVSSAPTGRR